MAAATSVATTQLYMDEKWKLSKKEGSRSRSSTSSNSSLMRNSSTSSLMRNSSNTPTLMRNSSTTSLMRNASTTPSLMRNSSTSSLVRNSSQRRSSFSRKCSSLVKEQRAKFYIMRRCVTMLICWRDYRDA